MPSDPSFGHKKATLLRLKRLPELWQDKNSGVFWALPG